MTVDNFSDFILRATLYDFGGLQIYRQCLVRSKIENINSFGISR